MTKTATPKKGVGRKRKGLDAKEKFKAFQTLKDAKQQGVDKITEDGVIIGDKAIHRSVFDAACDKLAAYAPPFQLSGTGELIPGSSTTAMVGVDLCSARDDSGFVFGVPADRILATTSKQWYGPKPGSLGPVYDDDLGTPILGYLFAIVLIVVCAIVVASQLGVFK